MKHQAKYFNMELYLIITQPNATNFHVSVTNYLTRHIYIRYNSGDLNDVGTKIWGFFFKNRQISYPKLNHGIWGLFFISLFCKNETQYLRKLIKLNIKFEK